jgi:hypothetical protein
VPVTIRVVGDLRRFVDADEVELGGTACTLGTVLDELTGRNPRLQEQLFDREGRLHYAVVLSVNGRAASWPQHRELLIEDGGEMIVTRFHSGG